MNAWIKMLCAALLFALWGALVFTHQADPKELVSGIQLALLGLGVFHAATNSKQSASAVAGLADAAEPAAPAEPALAAGGYQPKAPVTAAPPAPAAEAAAPVATAATPVVAPPQTVQ
jgi:hypothetical protein